MLLCPVSSTLDVCVSCLAINLMWIIKDCLLSFPSYSCIYPTPHHDRRQDLTNYSGILTQDFFFFWKFFSFGYEWPGRPRPPAGAGGSLSREPHRGLVFLANYTHYPGSWICSFYQAGLNAAAQLSGKGPQQCLTTFVEWVLVSCKPKFTVDLADDDTQPTIAVREWQSWWSPQSPSLWRQTRCESQLQSSPRWRVSWTARGKLPLLALPAIPAASAPPPLAAVSPSAHPQTTICALDSPRVCQSPLASWLEDPLSPPPASESWTPPRPFDPVAPPWLLAPSSPPWSVVDHPPPRDSTPQATSRPSCSVRLFFPASSNLGPQLFWLHHGLPDPHLRLGRRRHLLLLGPPDPQCHPGSSALRLHYGLHRHLLRRRRLAPWICLPFCHHGSALHQLYRGPLSWLWPGSHLATPSAPFPFCRHPGFSCFLLGYLFYHHHFGLCCSSSSRSSNHRLNLLQPVRANFSPSLHFLFPSLGTGTFGLLCIGFHFLYIQCSA